MDWKIDELKKILEKLKTMPVTPSLCSDINILNYMLYYLDNSLGYIPLKYSDSSEEEHQEKRIDFIAKNYKQIKKSLEELLDIRISPKGLFFHTRMDVSQLDDVVQSFFKSYDLNLLSKYIDIKDNSRLTLRNIPYPFSTATGMTFPIYSIGKCYVGTRHHNRFFSSSSLVHELGHVYQIEDVNDFSLQDGKLNSIWSEAFPLFLEEAYIEFLKDNSREKMGTRLRYESLDSFVSLVDYCYDKFFSYSLNDGIKRLKDEKRFNYSLSRLLSFFLASYLLNQHQEDSNIGKSSVDTFNSMIGTADDSEILETFDSKLVFDSPKKLINKYQRNI